MARDQEIRRTDEVLEQRTKDLAQARGYARDAGIDYGCDRGDRRESQGYRRQREVRTRRTTGHAHTHMQL
jgi:hypothetical protein